MKKYSLTIIYDDNKEEVSSVSQKIVDLNPEDSGPQKLQVEMNVRFASQLQELSQETINDLLGSADRAGGQMGDA